MSWRLNFYPLLDCLRVHNHDDCTDNGFWNVLKLCHQNYIQAAYSTVHECIFISVGEYIQNCVIQTNSIPIIFYIITYIYYERYTSMQRETALPCYALFQRTVLISATFLHGKKWHMLIINLVIKLNWPDWLINEQIVNDIWVQISVFNTSHFKS